MATRTVVVGHGNSLNTSPAISIGFSLTINDLDAVCVNTTISTAPVYIWLWEFLDENSTVIDSAATQDATFTAPNPGIYSVRLTATTKHRVIVSTTTEDLLLGTIVIPDTTAPEVPGAFTFAVSDASEISGTIPTHPNTDADLKEIVFTLRDSLGDIFVTLGNNPLILTPAESVATNPAFSFTGNFPAGNYTLEAYSKDITGNVSALRGPTTTAVAAAGPPPPGAFSIDTPIDAISSTTIDISWTASTDAVHYTIFKRITGSGDPFTSVFEVSATTAVVGGFTPEEEYDIKVVASNQTDDTDSTNIPTVVMPQLETWPEVLESSRATGTEWSVYGNPYQGQTKADFFSQGFWSFNSLWNTGVLTNGQLRVESFDDVGTKYGRYLRYRAQPGDGSNWQNHGPLSKTSAQNGGPWLEIYFRFVFRFSDPWEQSGSVAKFWYFGQNGANSNAFAIEFRNSFAPFKIQIDADDVLTNPLNPTPPPTRVVQTTIYRANSNQCNIFLNTWHTVEFWIRRNTAYGNTDGAMRLAIDGQEEDNWTCAGAGCNVDLQGNGDNVRFFQAIDTAVHPNPPLPAFGGTQFFLFWGSGGNFKTIHDHIDIAELYMKVKR